MVKLLGVERSGDFKDLWQVFPIFFCTESKRTSGQTGESNKCLEKTTWQRLSLPQSVKRVGKLMI